MVADDCPDARGPRDARNVRQAADGAGCDRRSVGHGGLTGLGATLQSDGDDQPQSWTVEPDADSGPRRRAHCDTRDGGALAARLQHAREGEDAPGRLRAAPGPDGDGDLQRPDARRVVRAPDSLALATSTV